MEASVARFEQWMTAPDSPIRAIRHQAGAARPLRRYSGGVTPPFGPCSRRGESRGCTRIRRRRSGWREGKNVVVVTPTASGKTLCYNLPVLRRLVHDPGARAMYLFPTKALAEDQLHELQAAVDATGAEIRAFTYDGDTPQDARKAIRERANMVLTNPDMLHAASCRTTPNGRSVSRTCGTS